MPRLTVSNPKYALHKASGQAVVTLDGKDYYLGPFKSQPSLDEYNRLVGLWQANGRRMPPDPSSGLSVNEILLRYLDHAERYYVKNGKPTGEIGQIKAAIKPLVELYGTQVADGFRPLALKSVREKMIGLGWCRSSVNKQVNRLKRIFKWAAENELVRGEVAYALQAVAGLRRGRCEAAETEPVKPAPEAHVQAVLPHVSPQVRTMIQLQALTGMRPETVTILRSGDIDTSGPVWIYRPHTHKTEHHGMELLVHLGPRAQALLRPFLKSDLSAYLFSPREAQAQRSAEQRRNRRTPMTPSQARRRPKEHPQRSPGDRYSVAAYRRAIARACAAANVPAWCPRQLRHNAATRLRKEFGLEAAQVVLGHQTAVVTQIYAERDHAKAAEVMARVG